MERRDFLKAAVAVPFAAAIPAGVALAEPSPWIPVSDYVGGVVVDDWLCMVHPSVESDLREMVARDEWSSAYRSFRTQNTEKKSVEPRDIFARFKLKPFDAEMIRAGGICFATTAPIGAL